MDEFSCRFHLGEECIIVAESIANGRAKMRVKVDQAGRGLHPSDVIVRVPTLEGPQELVVNERSLRQNAIEVGHPVAQHDGKRFLIELPSETNVGAWRVWVRGEMLLDDDALEAAE